MIKETGRIVKGIGGLYFVDSGKKIFECSARGLFRKNKIVPTVGDFVEIDIISDNKGCIQKIFERKNELIRPKVANIDICIITFAAASPAINMDLLDRFLILTQCSKIDAVICINKCDKASKDVLEYISRVYAHIYDVVYTSTVEKIGIDDLKKVIRDKVCVFAGPSGVGKSSIINCIVPDINRETGDISRKIERGKHTTREVNLIDVSPNTYIVDSPGFTSLSLEHIASAELQFYFKEFLPFLGQCRFNDCLHIKEPECSVKEHIGAEISQERYDRYKFLFEEIKQRR